MVFIMNNKKQYIPRLFDDVLSFALKSKGAVLVVGLNGVVNLLPVKNMLKPLSI